MAEGTKTCLFAVLAVLQVVTVSAQSPCESPVFTNGMLFEALMENSPENTTIVANMSFAGTAFGSDRTIELTLQDSGDKDWGLLIEELQQLRLRLGGRVLDRDGVLGTRDLRFIVRCKTIATDAMVDNSVIATVLDLNDNEPTFVGAPYNQEVIELTPVGSTIFRRLTANDPDSNENSRVSYQIEGQSDYFEIPLPSTGDIILKKSLDYEGFQPGEEKKYLIPVVAHDLAANESMRLSSTTTVTIIVTDGDDQAVQFLPCVPLGDICGSPLYVSSVMENTEPLNQPLNFDPAPVFAVDLDTDVQGPPGIVYSFLAGSPSDFRDYFDIDGPTGNITLNRPVERTEVEEFIITVKAEQDDNPLRYATADVKIGVEDDDVNKPYFFISTGESEFKGYVRQFIGQAVIVFRYDESPLRLEVKDDDFADKVVPKGALRYELTDTSGRFEVTDTGYLLVDANQLDIDKQKEYRMTVRAVETTTFQKLSTDEATVVITVLNGIGREASPTTTSFPKIISSGTFSEEGIMQTTELLGANKLYQGDSTNYIPIAAMAGTGVVAALLLIGLVAAVAFIVVSKRKDGTARAPKAVANSRNPGARTGPTFDNRVLDEVGNSNNRRSISTGDDDSEYAIPDVAVNSNYQALDPNTRINSEYQKLTRGGAVPNGAFDGTYNTDTRTNRASDNGIYCEVMDGGSTKHRGQSHGTSQHGAYEMPGVGSEEGAYYIDFGPTHT